MDAVSGGDAQAVEPPSPSIIIAVAAKIFRMWFPVVGAPLVVRGQPSWFQREENLLWAEVSENTHGVAAWDRSIAPIPGL
jgi:hypothetical protein